MDENKKPPHAEEPDIKYTPVVRSLLGIAMIALGVLGLKHSISGSGFLLALGCLLLTLSVE